MVSPNGISTAEARALLDCQGPALYELLSRAGRLTRERRAGSPLRHRQRAQWQL
jgi:hypothetical protein